MSRDRSRQVKCQAVSNLAGSPTATDAVAQNSGGNEVQDRLFAVDNQRVARIVTSLKARHRSRAVREEVNNFSFAFVTPLGADDDDILTHAWSVFSWRVG